LSGEVFYLDGGRELGLAQVGDYLVSAGQDLVYYNFYVTVLLEAGFGAVVYYGQVGAGVDGVADLQGIDGGVV